MAGYVADAPAGPLSDSTEGGTALHLAAANGHIDVVRCLLRANASAGALDHCGRSALDLAIINGHFGLCAELLDAGCWFAAGPSASSEGGAAGSSKADIKGGNCGGGGEGVSVKTSGATAAEGAEDKKAASAAGDGQQQQQQQQPTDCGSSEGGLDAASLLRLLSHPDPQAQPGFERVTGMEVVAPAMGLTFVECCARAGCLEAVQLLAARRSHGSHGLGVAVLGAAVLSQNTELVAWLLDPAGGCCSLKAALEQHDLLHEAASRGCVPCMAALLTASEREAGGGTPGSAAVAPQLLARPDLGGQQRTPLHAALLHGQVDMALYLIERMSDACPAALAAPDASGWAPLHHAAFRGLDAVVAALLCAPGVEPDAAASCGQRPLHLAAKAGHVGAALALLDAGAAPDAADGAGHLPLHHVALRGDFALFSLLFSLSAPALTPASGALLLSCAIRGGCMEVVAAVLLAGVASPEACIKAGQAPAQAAAREGYVSILRFLKGAGHDLKGEIAA